MAPPSPLPMAGDGEQRHGASSTSASSGASSSVAGSSSPSPAPTPLAVVPSSSSAASVAPPPPPLQQQQQQQILHNYHHHHQLQHQLQQPQRLLSLHLSTSSPPSAPPALLPPPASAGLKPPTADPAPSDRHSREDCWSEDATLTLIQAWGDHYLELNRGNLKQKHWKDVAGSVNSRARASKAPTKTDVQCKNRLDTLKKKYKLEKSKIVTGGAPSKWPFFERLDELIGPLKKPKAPVVKVRPLGGEGQGPLCTASKRPLEEEQKAPLLFSVPPPAVGPPPPINNHAGGSAADTASKSKGGPDMSGSWPPKTMPDDGKRLKRKRAGHRSEEDNPFKDLARAILKFGDVYERMEAAKQQQMVELEKQRMEFTKDLELQRLQFFMQTQVELAKMKHGSSSKHSNTGTLCFTAMLADVLRPSIN